MAENYEYNAIFVPGGHGAMIGYMPGKRVKS